MREPSPPSSRRTASRLGDDVQRSVAKASADGLPREVARAPSRKTSPPTAVARSSSSARASRPSLHALAHAINAALGAPGASLTHAPVADPDELDAVTDLKALTDAIAASQVDALVILGGNPVYDAPADLGVRRQAREGAVQRARFALRRRDEREVHLARAARPRVRVVGRRARARRERQRSAASHRAALRRARRHRAARPDGERAREDGVTRRFARRVRTASLAHARSHRLRSARRREDRVPRRRRATRCRSAAPIWSASGAARWPWACRRDRRRRLRPGRSARRTSRPPSTRRLPAPVGPGALEVTFAPCPKMVDGAHANNTWLQEMPDPVTKLVWDNAAIVSPATAKALGSRARTWSRSRSATGRSPRACGSCPARPTTRSR